MREIARRLHRLEQRLSGATENWQTRQLRMRLEAARHRCNLPAIAPTRLAELRGRNIVEILLAGRQRVSWPASQSEELAVPQSSSGAGSSYEYEEHRSPD